MTVLRESEATQRHSFAASVGAAHPAAAAAAAAPASCGLLMRASHAPTGLALLLPPRGAAPLLVVAITCMVEGRLATMRSSHRLHTRLKKWASSALVVACGGGRRHSKGRVRHRANQSATPQA